MSRPNPTVDLPYNSPVNVDNLDITVGDPTPDGLIPIRVGSTGQVIKLHANTPPENVMRIIEGHVRAVRRARVPGGGMPGFRDQQTSNVPTPPGQSIKTSMAGGPIDRFLNHAVSAIAPALDPNTIGSMIDRFRSDPRGAIQSLASPQNLPATEDTRIPTPPIRNSAGQMVPAPNSTPLRPALPATAVESIPIIGPILTNIRTAQEREGTAAALGEALPVLPSAIGAGAGAVRGAISAGRSLASGGTALESAITGLDSAMLGRAPVQPRPTVRRIGNVEVPLMLDEVNANRPGLAEVFGRLGSTSQPVKDFNEARTGMIERAIKQESQSIVPPGVLRTLDGTELDGTPFGAMEGHRITGKGTSMDTGQPVSFTDRPFPERLSSHDLDKLTPLQITEIRSSLDSVSYNRLLQHFFGQVFEDSMKPGAPNAPPKLDPKLLMQKIDGIPKENLEAIFDSGTGLGTRGVPVKVAGAQALKNMRDLAETMGEIEDNGALVGKIERLHVAGYRRFGPMFLYLQDATGLIGVNHLAGMAITNPGLMQGLKTFLKSAPKSAAEMAAGESVIERAIEENYPKENSDDSSLDIKLPLLSDRSPGSNDAVLSDLVDSISGDPRLFSAAMDQVDNILYGTSQTNSLRAHQMQDLGINPSDIKLGEMPFGPGEGAEAADQVLRRQAIRAYRPDSLGSAFNKVGQAIRGHAIPTGGGDPSITADILKSRVPETELQKTGILDWLNSKISSGAKIYRSELQQLFKNLQYRAKDASPAEFELVKAEAGTPQISSVAEAARAGEIRKNRSAINRITDKVTGDEGPGLLDTQVKSIEELAAIPGRPSWAEVPGGGKQYIPALDHRVLTENKNWKRLLFQAKSDIDSGYTSKTPAQIKKAEETLIRVLAKYRKWEQETATKYEGIKIEPPISIKSAKAGAVGGPSSPPSTSSPSSPLSLPGPEEPPTDQ